MELTFALTEEQQALRDTARRFLRDRSGTDKVREDMATTSGFDERLWKEIAQQGWQAIAIPEAYGGAGYGPVEQAVLMEEMGRTLFCAPYLSSVVLGATAVMAAGSEDQKQRLLPGIASGETRVTVALPPSSTVDGIGVEEHDGTLAGELPVVLDGHTAGQLIVPARTGATVTLFLVDGDADGVTREHRESLDQTRKLARVRLGQVTAEPLGERGTGWNALDQVLVAGAVALANEQVGGAQRVLDMAVEYARTRKQFGRAIGSFQAIKHRCAELLVEVESARSAAAHAARALGAGDADEVAIAAPLARSYCSEVYEHAAGENIQIHGGIGFTWEHDAHLYFKRAKSSKLLLGDPVAWRRRLADTLGL